MISIPRDSRVDIPGHGMAKINAAFSLAGPSLAVETVEQLTGVRIDHLAVIDWSGFAALTDAVGGVEMTVPRTVEDPRNHVVWTRGRQHLALWTAVRTDDMDGWLAVHPGAALTGPAP